MAKYAFIKNGVVQLVEDINAEEYPNHIPHWDSIIDVTNLIHEPKIGWIVFNNVLVAVSPEEQQRVQQIYGTNLALELVNKVGTINLTMASQGETVNVASLLNSLASIKMLLETGALKTARGLCTYYKPQYPAYANVFQLAETEITNFLTERGWQ
jgi:hypothetical protein